MKQELLDELTSVIGKEIFKLNVELNQDLIKTLWNDAIEASARLIETKMPNLVQPNMMAFEVRKELKVIS